MAAQRAPTTLAYCFATTFVIPFMMALILMFWSDSLFQTNNQDDIP